MKNFSKKDIETAYHEAGHAVAALALFGINRVRKISIIPRKKDYSLGRMNPRKIRMQPDVDVPPAVEIKLMNMMIENYAGVVAGKYLTGRSDHRGAYSDYEDITNLRSYLSDTFDPLVDKYLDKYLYRRAELLVNWGWPQIQAVAKELLKRKELSNDEFYKIINSSDKQESKWLNKPYDIRQREIFRSRKKTG